MSRSELDLEKALKKACSIEEAAPKRKHVRACIVYTWDHKSAKSFFNALKVQPFAQDEVQLFKALITLHKVLQEGHQSALTEAIRNRDWIESLGRIYSGGSSDGYGRLINEYVRFLLQKVDFHRSHRGFNGTFEYEEYVSLVTTSNPDEGYETILDLMDLQDGLDELGHVIFSSIGDSRRSECKISALVPLVAESYGIYKFITSMIRAMHKQLGDDEALVPLHERYVNQHARLFEFYADCSAIRYLTSVIRIPKLPAEAPSLDEPDEDVVPSSREKSETPLSRNMKSSESLKKKESPVVSSSGYVPDGATGYSGVVPAITPVVTGFATPSLTGGVNSMWGDSVAQQYQAAQDMQQQLLLQQQQQQQQQQMQLEQERQRQLQLQQEQELLERQRQEQMMQQQQQQAAFEEQLRQQQTAQQEVLHQQVQNDLVALRDQHERDQLLLQQYDERVSSLEKEIENLNLNASNQLENKEEQVKSLEQWKDKYEALARLYAQLRQEHLQLLQKLKHAQKQASSAKEAIVRREEYERDLKNKDEDLRGALSERDALRLSVDRMRKQFEKVVVTAGLRTLEDEEQKGIKKVSHKGTALASAFNNFIADGLNGDLVDLAKSVSEFTAAIIELSAGREEASKFLEGLLSLSGTDEEKTDTVINLNVAMQKQLQDMEGTYEIEKVAEAIMAVSHPEHMSGAVDAILALIKASIECQKENAAPPSEFYKKKNKWTEGLVSAAKAVAKATEIMIAAESYEEFVVASNEVVASTVQLVAASRVKSDSPAQRKLEERARIVSTAVKNLLQTMNSESKEFDYSKLSEHENKTAEMEQQVEIVKLENALEEARKRLGEIRKYSYVF